MQHLAYDFDHIRPLALAQKVHLLNHHGEKHHFPLYTPVLVIGSMLSVLELLQFYPALRLPDETFEKFENETSQGPDVVRT